MISAWSCWKLWTHTESFCYSSEDHVVEFDGKSKILFDEIQSRFGFVGGCRSEYVAYFHRSDLLSNYWVLRQQHQIKAISRCSAIPQKDQPKQRKLLMACDTNCAWSVVRRRSDNGLLGAAALSGVHCPTDCLEVAAFDDSNAFSFVRTPEWMWPWFAVPPLISTEVWSLLSADLRASVGPSGWVYPCYTRLATGLSHAVYLLMNINITYVGRAFAAGGRLQDGTRELSGLESAGKNLDDPSDHARSSSTRVRSILEQRSRSET